MNKAETRAAIVAHYAAQGDTIHPAGTKGDGFFVGKDSTLRAYCKPGSGFVLFQDARTAAGIPPHTPAPRVKRESMPAWGDYATIAALHGRLKG